MEKRRSARKIRPGEITFSYKSGYCNVPEKTEIFACIIDANDSGLCLMSSYPLEKGQSIIIKTGLDCSGLIGEVRWARQVVSHIYKGGICLEDTENGKTGKE